MPNYSYKCTKCGYKFDEVCMIKFRNDAKKCPMCLGPAGRDEETELATRSEDNEDHVRYSFSLGVVNPNDPVQMQEKLKTHPGAEFDGLGRMIIHNRKEKLQRMKEAGMEEY